MNRTTANALQAKIKAAVDQVLAAEGFKVEHFRSSYMSDETQGTSPFSFRGSIVSTNPAQDPLRLAWPTYAASYGLPLNGVGLIFSTPRGTYEITGLDVYRRKYPVVTKEVSSGKTFIFPADFVAKQFAGTPAAVAS